MPTRRARSHGGEKRTWRDLNLSIGDDDRMESEVLYMALRADGDNRKDILVNHYGSLGAALDAIESLRDDVAERFEEVMKWLGDNA